MVTRITDIKAMIQNEIQWQRKKESERVQKIHHKHEQQAHIHTQGCVLHQTVVVAGGGGGALDTFSCDNPPRPMDALLSLSLALRQPRLCVAKITQAFVICAKRKYDEKEEKQPAHMCTPCGCAQFDDSANVNLRPRNQTIPSSISAVAQGHPLLVVQWKKIEYHVDHGFYDY